MSCVSPALEHLGDRVADQLVERDHRTVDATALGPAQREQRGDDPFGAQRRALDVLGGGARRVAVGVGEQDVGFAAHDRERGAELVRDLGREAPLRHEGLLEAVEHVVERVGEILELVVGAGRSTRTLRSFADADRARLVISRIGRSVRPAISHPISPATTASTHDAIAVQSRDRFDRVVLYVALHVLEGRVDGRPVVRAGVEEHFGVRLDVRLGDVAVDVELVEDRVLERVGTLYVESWNVIALTSKRDRTPRPATRASSATASRSRTFTRPLSPPADSDEPVTEARHRFDHCGIAELAAQGQHRDADDVAERVDPVVPDPRPSAPRR